MTLRSLFAVLASVLLVAPNVAIAQDKPVSLSSDVKLVRLVRDDTRSEGVRTELVEPTTVVPGDTLAFSISYHNGGSEPVTDFVIVNPVPANLQLADDSTGGPDVSIDGGKSWGRLEALTVIEEDGTERRATTEDVTHLRWVVALLNPGESGSTGFHAFVR